MIAQRNTPIWSASGTGDHDFDIWITFEEVNIHHSFRESLLCADWLAKKAHAWRRPPEMLVLNTPPDYCLYQLLKLKTKIDYSS